MVTIKSVTEYIRIRLHTITGTRSQRFFNNIVIYNSNTSYWTVLTVWRQYVTRQHRVYMKYVSEVRKCARSCSCLPDGGGMTYYVRDTHWGRARRCRRSSRYRCRAAAFLAARPPRCGYPPAQLALPSALVRPSIPSTHLSFSLSLPTDHLLRPSFAHTET